MSWEEDELSDKIKKSLSLVLRGFKSEIDYQELRKEYSIDAQHQLFYALMDALSDINMTGNVNITIRDKDEEDEEVQEEYLPLDPRIQLLDSLKADIKLVSSQIEGEKNKATLLKAESLLNKVIQDIELTEG